MIAVFVPALATMERNGDRTFGPVSFQGYLLEYGLSAKNTAQYISVDALRGLAPELRESGTMVFRLGAVAGEKNTRFGLARFVTGWGDYFLLDDTLFGGSSPEPFIPPVSMRRLFAFTLLPKFTETSLVNLALASGLLSHALGLNDEDLPAAPATGQGTYSFLFSPHQDLNVEWEHTKGQVEIDAAVIAKHRGVETLFVVEAKAGKDFDSLAKHKLLFPALALRATVPPYIPVVPVYMRVCRRADGLHFHIARCDLGDVSGGMSSVAGLTATSTTHLVLPGFGRG